MNGLYAIPLGVPFLPALVEGLVAQTTPDPLSLGRYSVILPTRRGCRALHNAFLAATPEGCRVLPRIMALADIEEGANLPGYIPPEILPPAMPPWRRLGIMSQLVLAFEKRKDAGSLNLPGSVRLAQELMRLVDEVETTGLDFSHLKTLVGTDYATHWQLTLDFLKILTDFWPPILEQEGCIEPAARRRLVLEQVTAHWKPTSPVILAGTTATRPATARLAQAILGWEKGCVVLPGVDMDLSFEERQTLPPTHPQYTLAQLINHLGSPKLWPTGFARKAPSRAILLSQAMTANPQEAWRISPEIAEEALSSVQAIEAPSILEEARQIALIMRYELETPKQVIALVTPDGELTRRVMAALGRWGLRANLSSGFPLSQSLVGRFLSLTSLLAQDITAADLLALLKHPLYAKGRDRLSHLKATRRFELEILRKTSPSQVQMTPFPGCETCAPLLALNDGRPHPFQDFLKTHAAVAEALAGSLPEGPVLWEEEDGQAALTFWKALLEHASNFPPLTGQDYPPFLHNLMAQEVVRDVEGIGSRLLVLGTLEARLLQADVAILGGLNEGTWPGSSEDDPWLSHSMRENFGLPSLERKIGLSAHDFCTAMTAPKIYMTRALKRNGAPTLPSRWWQRLSALLATSGKKLSASQPWGAWSLALDQPSNRTMFTPPAPYPPLPTRPTRLSVTEVETLLRDPYSIYAKKILKLSPLNPLDADLSMLERGQAIHQVLDAFIRCAIDPESPEAMAVWEDLGREAFGSLLSDPRAMAFWWPRFQRLGLWFLKQMALAKDAISEIRTEVEGTIEIPTAKGAIVLTAKADRIDILPFRQACLIDYKTGVIPSQKSVSLGYAPQLPLEGAILKRGGFLGLPPLDVEKLCYWKVTGGAPAGEVIPLNKAADLISAAEQGVQRLFEAFLGGETPFYACPDPQAIPPYHHYAHLERLKEWG